LFRFEWGDVRAVVPFHSSIAERREKFIDACHPDGLRCAYSDPCRPRLLEELSVARADGRYSKLLASFARIDLLIIDDLALAPLTAEGRRDLLEILDDRHQARSTIVTSQLPVAQWHDYLADPTVADAILDRLVDNSYRITLNGESMRKRHAPN
jgi:DNA replication protein DnaC